tara:strand:- start:186 stop:374 length:189 start_codon:yes stop_codon:yes gene_type:complete
VSVLELEPDPDPVPALELDPALEEFKDEEELLPPPPPQETRIKNKLIKKSDPNLLITSPIYS